MRQQRGGYSKYLPSTIVNESGESLTIVDNVARFARENALDYWALQRVITGRQKLHRGWHLIGADLARKVPKRPPNPNATGHKIALLSPLGEVAVFLSIAKAAKHIGTTTSRLWRMANGVTPTTEINGWEVIGVEGRE